MERICDFRQHSPCMDITAVSCLIVVAVIVVDVVAVVLVVAVVVKEKEDIHVFR